MLSAEQIEARRGKLTGSKIAALMTGDAQKIHNLWLELTEHPDFVPEDLSNNWAVRLGECTESLSCDWYEQKNRTLITRRGEVVPHFFLSWAACTLDGWDETLDCPIEVKHVGGHEPLEVILDRYAPQLQWIMEVCVAEQVALSVIMGANEPIVEYITRDKEYAAEMVRRGTQFMAHVRDRTSPVVLDPVPSPVVADQTYDMQGNNAWGSAASVWLETKQDAERCKDAEKILKSLVPADAKKCEGHNVYISRDRAGRLSLRENQQAIFERTGALI